MLLKKITIVLGLLFYVSARAYDVAYLKTLEQQVRSNLNSLQWTLWCTNGGEAVKRVSDKASYLGYSSKELAAVPRFKSIAKIPMQEFTNWIESQTDSSVDTFIAAVDKHKSVESLVEWQDSTYSENLDPNEAFIRLFQREHFKIKNSKKS